MTDTTEALAAPAPAASAAPRLRRRPRREAIWGYVFIGPWLIGLALFTAGPMIASLVMSLTDFDLVHPDETQVHRPRQLRPDGDATRSSRSRCMVTFKFAADRDPAHDAREPRLRRCSLNSPQLFGRSIFRTLFYMPIQIPLVASTLVWIGFLNTETGWLNGILGAVGTRRARTGSTARPGSTRRCR